MGADKKRKIEFECRVFKEEWTNLYWFISVKDKSVCLLCHETVSVFKEYNLKRHYLTIHLNF